jgi:hypothetical protein
MTYANEIARTGKICTCTVRWQIRSTMTAVGRSASSAETSYVNVIGFASPMRDFRKKVKYTRG